MVCLRRPARKDAKPLLAPNQPVINMKTSAPSKRPWLWAMVAVSLTPVVALAVLAAGVASCFRSGSEVRALRRELAKVGGPDGRKQVSLSAGRVVLSAIRAGLSFAPLEPEVRAALRAVRSVDLSVWDVACGINGLESADFLAAADNALCARGWERVVGVMDGNQTVGVYLSTRNDASSRMNGCVVVLDGQQIVIACVRADLAPLLIHVRNMNRWHEKLPRASAHHAGTLQHPPPPSALGWLLAGDLSTVRPPVSHRL